MNALVLPNEGLVHDARLYAFQVMNHVEQGRYEDDLFLKHRSQDNYSIFSSLAAPVVEVVGLEYGFVLMYLFSNALLYWGVTRLFLQLIPEKPIAVLSVLFVAVSPIYFAGLYIFTVNESFLTARVCANAFTLLSLDRLLAGRYTLAFLYIMLGMALHPVMAFCGVLILSFYLAYTYIPLRILWWLAGAMALGIGFILANNSIGSRLFGEFDSEWREIVFRGSYFSVMSEWLWRDWLYIGLSILVALWAAAFGGFPPSARRFIGAACVTGLLASIGGWLSLVLPYALLFQGQPYRALWMVQLLFIPLSLRASMQLWQQRRSWSRFMAVALLGSLGASTGWPTGAGLTPLYILLFIIIRRGMRPFPKRADWPSWSVAASLCLVFILAPLMECAQYIGEWSMLNETFPNTDWFHLFIQSAGPLYALPIGVLLTSLLIRIMSFGFIPVSLLLALLLQLLPQWAGVQIIGLAKALNVSEMHLVKKHLAERTQEEETTPTIYMPTMCLEEIWIDLEANSFFSWQQKAGAMFSRKTALEGNRRALLVAPFERAWFKRYRRFYPPWWIESTNRVYPPTEENSLPGEDDFLRLCEDPAIDFVIIPFEFSGHSATRIGNWYVYECRAKKRAD